MKLDNQIQQRIRELFKQKYNWNMTDNEYEEVRESLRHLGKAIFMYHKEMVVSRHKQKDMSR